MKKRKHLTTEKRNDSIMKGKLSSASSGHRHYMFGFGLVLWSAITLVAIMGCFAEVTLPPFNPPESQVKIYFSEKSFNVAVSELSKNMSRYGVKVMGANDSFESYAVQNFTISPVVLNLFDVSISNQELSTSVSFGRISNKSMGSYGKKEARISFSSLVEADVALVFNKFFAYGFAGFFTHDLSDFFVIVNGASDPIEAPPKTSGVPYFIGVLSFNSRVEKLRFLTTDSRKDGEFSMDNVYLVFSKAEIDQPISVHYNFDAWVTAAQDLPTFQSLEAEDFERFNPSSFNSSLIHFNMFSLEMSNPNITQGSITMGVGNYETDLIIGNLALDGDLQSSQQLALILEYVENPSVLLTFNDVIIGFGGFFFHAFTDSGISFQVNGQNITFAADNSDATFLGVVIPSGTTEILILVTPGSDSFQTFILDNVWIVPHCCMAAKCTVEGIEIASGKSFSCVAAMDQHVDTLPLSQLVFLLGVMVQGTEVAEIPLKCLDDRSFLAQVDVCSDGGVVVQQSDRIVFCPDFAPNCQQCGATRRGGALCVAANSEVSNCSFAAGFNDRGCLVGNNNYAVPIGYQITPYVFEQCTDDQNYFSSSLVCGFNLYADVSVTKMQCPEENPFCFENGCVEGSNDTKILLIPVTSGAISSSANVVHFEVANPLKEKRCLNTTKTGIHDYVCHEMYTMDLSKSSNLTISFEPPINHYLVPSGINASINLKFRASIVMGSASQNVNETLCDVRQAFNITGASLTVNIFGINCDTLRLNPSSFVSISNCGIDSVIEYLGFSNQNHDSFKHRQHRNSSDATVLISKIVVAANYDPSKVDSGDLLFQDSSANGVTGVNLLSKDELSSDSNLSLAPFDIHTPAVELILNPAGPYFEPAANFYLVGSQLFQVVSPMTEKINCAPAWSDYSDSQGHLCSGLIKFSMDDSSWITFTFAAGEGNEMVLEGTVEDSLILEFRATSSMNFNESQTVNCTEGVQKISGSGMSLAIFGSNSSYLLFNSAASSSIISACELSIIAKFDVSSGTKVVLEKISISAFYDRSLAPKGVQLFWYNTADKMDIRTSSFALIQVRNQKLPLCCTQYSMPRTVQSLRRIPRFRYSTNINSLIFSSQQRNGYVIGLVIFPSIILGILFLWLTVIVCFKLFGTNRFGILSGFNAKDMSYQHVEKKQHARRLRPFHIIFFLSSLLIYVFTSTFLVLGIKNLHDSTKALQRNVANLQLLVSDAKEPLNKLNSTAKGLLRILPQISSFCSSDRTINIEAIKLSLALTHEEILVGLEKNTKLLQSNIDFFENKLESADMYLNELNESMKYVAFYIVPLVILNCFMFGSATLTWFDVKNRTWLCLHQYATLPFFIIIICISWCSACALLAWCLLNSDFCSGGVAHSPYGTLNETISFLGFDSSQILAYYASCNVPHPAGAWWTQYENYVGMAVTTGQSFIENIKQQNFTRACSPFDQEIAYSFIAVFNDFSSALSSISSAASYLSCQQISPIYNKAFNQKLCTSSIASFLWMMWSLLMISLCGMMMITFRAVAIPSVANFAGDSVMTGSGQEKQLEMEANFVGKEICVDDSELFENLSIDSDLRSFNFQCGADDKSYHQTSLSVADFSSREAKESFRRRSNRVDLRASQSKLNQTARTLHSMDEAVAFRPVHVNEDDDRVNAEITRNALYGASHVSIHSRASSSYDR